MPTSSTSSSSGSCLGPDNSLPKDPFSERIDEISSMMGPGISRACVRRALAAAENNVNRAINFLIDNRGDEAEAAGAACADDGVGSSEMRRSRPESSSPDDRLSERIDEISSMLGDEVSRVCIRRALAAADGDVNRAINFLIDNPGGDEEDAAGAACANDGAFTHGISVQVGEHDNSSPEDPFLERIDEVSSMMGPEISRDRIRRALAAADNDVNRAINFLIDDNPNSEKDVILIDNEGDEMEAPGAACANGRVLRHETGVKEEPLRVSPQEDDVLRSETEMKREEIADNIDLLMPNTRAKKGSRKDDALMIATRVENDGLSTSSEKDACISEHGLAMTNFVPCLNPRPIRALRPPMAMNTTVQVVSGADAAEMDEFPEESDWFLLGRTYMTGFSTCRGKNKLQVSEVVHFSFPSEKKRVVGRQRASYKASATASEIVRFSTKRSGEIGKLPREWTRCLVPLVNSSRVKIRGRSVSQPAELSLMQDIILYVSIYIHGSIFVEGNNSSWTMPTPSYVDPIIHPLPTLFKLLKMKPTQKGDFIPVESGTRKRPLNLQDNDEDEGTHTMGIAKRIRGDQPHPERCDDEQAISESALNKLVGASDVYDLEEMEPPETLICQLKPYQKQALYWMSELEKGTGAGQVVKTLHPCWSAYNIVDRRAPAVYVNEFTGDATIQFPSATQTTKGGILADAMGLGKTVMTIALILARPGEERLGYQHESRRNGNSADRETSTIQGGTLIVCPMALLGQWKDELETHCRPGTLSVFVHYGGDKANHPRVISQYDVVLTTYGVLSSAYGSDSKNPSIFHRIHWHRIVLDEAHTIKASKTKVAQSAFALNSQCRWCLTGTPLQNSLEDLYSLLCFLHVEPWCNWTWWQKLIQGPYENGDERGLRLVKAILKPLMLRRTKDTKDKYGRPILVLPPATIQTVECIQSELERDIYDSLFWKSKVKFDQYVAQGKVLHNYANILELLLRLRQCCNHPFLLISRGDTQQHADLNKLARQFLEGLPSGSGSSGPTKAYVEEVVEGIRRGEASECPICLESASDDPVLTSCAHRMCRECLLSSWPTPSGGPCPICRNPLTKEGLITCPTDSRFQVDVEKNWKESSKVRKLIECLESLRSTGEKSIVFSQWTGFFDLVEIPLNRRSIGFLRFDGKLNQKQREKVLKEFNENKDKPVLLMSLKAGGVGLNLTAASNVFLMDPWWNPAVEEQAIMRIHRIGQKRQVRVRRFIVKDTVEERMQQVQARKQRMIAGALTDEEVRSARIEELKMLFR